MRSIDCWFRYRRIDHSTMQQMNSTIDLGDPHCSPTAHLPLLFFSLRNYLASRRKEKKNVRGFPSACEATAEAVYLHVHLATGNAYDTAAHAYDTTANRFATTEPTPFLLLTTFWVPDIVIANDIPSTPPNLHSKSGHLCSALLVSTRKEKM